MADLIHWKFLDFDTSCFTGTYVTGETIDSDYFQRLHQLRNDSAQESRRHGKPQKEVRVPASTSNGSEGCESVHNDQRKASEGVGGCEAI